MYLKMAIAALLLSLPLLSANQAQADEYLMISNLPVGTSAQDVKDLIKVHGEVKSIRCFDTQYSAGIKRSCHVLMWSKEHAANVVEALNGNDFAGKELYSKEIYPVPCPSVTT